MKIAAEPELFPGSQPPPFQPLRIIDGAGQEVENCVYVDTDTGECHVQVLNVLGTPVLDYTTDPDGEAETVVEMRPLPITLVQGDVKPLAPPAFGVHIAAGPLTEAPPSDAGKVYAVERRPGVPIDLSGILPGYAPPYPGVVTVTAPVITPEEHRQVHETVNKALQGFQWDKIREQPQPCDDDAGTHYDPDHTGMCARCGKVLDAAAEAKWLDDGGKCPPENDPSFLPHVVIEDEDNPGE